MVTTFESVLVPGISARDIGLTGATAAALDGIAHHAFRIDPDLADTDAFLDAYQWPLDHAANTIVVIGKRGGNRVTAMCVALASTKIDVNNVVRRTLDVRKVSFAPMAEAAAQTGMEPGSITPFGAP